MYIHVYVPWYLSCIQLATCIYYVLLHMACLCHPYIQSLPTLWYMYSVPFLLFSMNGRRKQSRRAIHIYVYVWDSDSEYNSHAVCHKVTSGGVCTYWYLGLLGKWTRNWWSRWTLYSHHTCTCSIMNLVHFLYVALWWTLAAEAVLIVLHWF